MASTVGTMGDKIRPAEAAAECSRADGESLGATLSFRRVRALSFRITTPEAWVVRWRCANGFPYMYRLTVGRDEDCHASGRRPADHG